MKIRLEILIYFLVFTFASAQNNDQQVDKDQWSLKSMKNKFEAGGVYTGFNYTGDLFSNLSGGIAKGSKLVNQFMFSVDLELNKFFDINKTIIHGSLLGVKGGMPNELVGSTQVTSNIETDNQFKLYDLWIDYTFNDNFSLLAGLFDINSEFDTKYNSLLFINPSHGIGAEFGLTGKNGPSIYPNTSLGARLDYRFGHDNYIKLGVFDAVPGTKENPYTPYFDFAFSDGLLLVSEFGYDCYSDYVIGSESPQCINFAIGAWYFTDRYEELSGWHSSKGNYGFYSFLESRIFYLTDKKIVSAFMRTGIADPNVNQIDLYFSGGFVLSNFLFEDDQLGIAFASSKNSRKFIMAKSMDHEHPVNLETNIELTYLVNVSDYLSLQPDLQYFINPSHDSQLSNAFCVGLRASIGL